METVANQLTRFSVAMFISGVLVLVAMPRSAAMANTFKKLTIDIAVEANGRYVQTNHSEASANNAPNAERMAQVPLAFNPSLEQLEITEAYTMKSDGTRKNVDAAAIKEQLPPEVRGSPVFADVREKVVIFPDFEAGDTRVITYRRQVFHPLFPGQFTWWDDFPRNHTWGDVHVTISAPASYRLYTESVEVPFERRAENDRVFFSWHFHARAQGAEHYAVAAIDRRPRIFVSSFAGYDAMAAAYDALNASKEAVTPSIRAKADAVTSGITDRREQARALYEWVSKHIRYVAIYLNRGSVEAHPAEAVLANGYGDCKDHVVLLAALLKAKGIASQTAMINLGTSYMLGGTPTLGRLNHVLTYISEFALYADSTLGVAPFGYLSQYEYGKPIVMVGAKDGARGQVPMPAVEDAVFRTQTKATLFAGGRIVGSTLTSGHGVAATSARFIGRVIHAQGSGATALAERQLALLGETGTGTLFVPDPDPIAPDATVSGKFTLEPEPGWLDGDAFTVPRGLALFLQPGDGLLGPPNSLSLAPDEPTPCMRGRQIEELSLTLPAGRVPVKLPAERRIEVGPFTYVAHWSMTDSLLARAIG